MTSKCLLLPAVLLLVFSGSCLAQVPAVTSFSGGTTFTSVDLTNLTLGWTFTANANITVSALGFWNVSPPSALQNSHQVGLWTASGTLLTSGTVQTNSPLTGSWAYVSVSPVALTSGQTYVVGTLQAGPFNDTYSRVPVSGGSVATSSLITIGTSVVSADSTGFVFPNVSEPTYLARFGPNLIVAQTPTPAVPISRWALLMIALGLAAAGLLQLRMGRRTSDTV
jgi:hypothetical protein